MVTDVQHDEQTADIAAAWQECRMIRLPLGDDGMSYRVLMLNGGRVIADFAQYQDEQGAYATPTNAIASLVDERVTESALKLKGWLRAKNVAYNTLSGDIEIRPTASRKRK